MLKQGMLIVCLVITVMFGSRAAYSQDCQTDPNCPCRDWAEVVKNLNWTMGNQPAYACADVKIRSGSRNAYDAFKDCNDAFRFKNDVTGVDTPAMYSSCAAYSCNWFKSKNLRPACAGNP